MKKRIIICSLFILISVVTFYVSNTFEINNLPKNIISLLTTKFNKKEKLNIKIDFFRIYMKSLEKNHFLIKDIEVFEEINDVLYNTTEPIVYIYSTHSNEEYSYSKNNIYNITPTVKTASYILEDELKKLGINSIVESENTISILNSRNLEYKDSYKISRELLEKRKKEYNSLIYFIDIHRDSVKRNITTTIINDESYAKIMFVLGLENKTYQENKKVINEINDYLNLNYNGISRGIYEKKGSGVNGIYNQDFSNNTMLIEIGGIDNTIEEVSNSVKIIANSLYNYINNQKTTN